MSGFEGVTASTRARIKEGKVEEVKRILDKYDYSCCLYCKIYDGCINIFGEDFPYFWPKDGDPDDFWYFDEFLEELSPLLSENWIIHTIGHDGCEFPLTAIEIEVTPDGVNLRGSLGASGCRRLL
jgi:hypothetical protein